MQTGLLTALGMVTVLPALSVIVRVPSVSEDEVSAGDVVTEGAFPFPQDERSIAEKTEKMISEISSFFMLRPS